MDVAVDINEQLTTLMALATQPPAIVRPYFDTEGKFQNLFDKLSSDHKIYREEFKAWVCEVGESRQFIIKLIEEQAAKINARHVDLLSQFAILFEKKAELNAIELTKYRKQTNKLLAKFKTAIGKDASAKMKPIHEAAFSQWHEEIEVYLDMALLLRGLAGKYDPDQEVVFTAKSPEDTEKLFKSIELN